MNGATLTRWRWRLRGAWMWPSFIVLTLLDGFIAHWRPPIGDHESAVGGWLIGLILTLIAIVVLVPPSAWVLRGVRMDLPRVVARDYVGTGVCLLITLGFVVVGLMHHPVTVSDQRAADNALATAEAYIGDHAPAPFMASVSRPANVDLLELQPPRIYRVCAQAWIRRPGDDAGLRSYCVVVDLSKPFGKSVSYAGSEPNSVLSQSTG